MMTKKVIKSIVEHRNTGWKLDFNVGETSPLYCIGWKNYDCVEICKNGDVNYIYFEEYNKAYDEWSSQLVSDRSEAMR